MYFEVLLFAISIIFIVLCVAYRYKKDYLNFYKLHVVIPGGSSGIGYDLCKQAFEKGANISIIARNKVITFNFMLSLFYRYLKLILFLFEPG